MWTGSRRWTPLACGLVLPLAIVASAARVPNPGLVFNFGTAASFLALGLAVLTAEAGEGGA